MSKFSNWSAALLQLANPTQLFAYCKSVEFGATNTSSALYPRVRLCLSSSKLTTQSSTRCSRSGRSATPRLIPAYSLP
eukprot:scaffold26318_cov36-Prasinocladus_malaysianus.AAC.1